MRGTVFRRKNRWIYSFDLPAGPDGKRRREWSRGFHTKREAEHALTAALRALDTGTHVNPSAQTVGAFLTSWLAGVRGSVRPSTAEAYRLAVERHLVPRLGGVRLQTLTAAHLAVMYADLASSGRQDGSGLARRSVRNVHLALHRALADAVAWGLVARNVADLTRPPSAGSEPAEMKVWRVAELRSFLEAPQVRAYRQYAALHLAATTGARRGEICGLRWRDVDLEAGALAVTQAVGLVRGELVFTAPKTARGRRSISLDAGTVAVLRDHQWRQMQEHFAAESWQDSGLVFTTPTGGVFDPNSLSGRFNRLVAALGLPRIRFHDLRHSYATAALQAGVHPRVVSERLGHASVAFTLDVYSHAVPGMQADAAERIAGLIFGT